MGKMSTREIIDGFYEGSGLSQSRIANVKKFVDIPILFEYERSIGKELVDMDQDEFIYLIRALLTKSLKPDAKAQIIMSDYKYVRTCLISICEWYSFNVEPIIIWLRSPELKGTKGFMRVLEISTKPVTWQDFDNIFADMRKNGMNDRADYTELITGLFYCGFNSLGEVIHLNEQDINLRAEIITLPGRTVKVSSRIISLLQKNHKATEYQTARRTVYMRSWRNSYLHFVVEPRLEDDFDNREESVIAIALNKLLSEYIRNGYGLKTTYKNIFWLGCYDYIVKKCGKERARELILSVRNSDDITELMSYAVEFGVAPYSISPAEVKNYLKMYLDQN